MGAVYEVVHLETNRRRALKVMLPHVLHSQELRERFQLEAKVAADIESEFIVDVFDAGYDEATKMPYLVMELLRGEELGKRLKRLGRLAPAEVVAVLHQTALALDKTHRASIVHRDLKPENLFLTEREDGAPRIKVLDFGVAKVVAESTTAGTTQTIGTPIYMAPEQFHTTARLTGAADLYALAMVSFTLLVGSAYWSTEARGGNVFALASVAMHGPREPASVRAKARGVELPAMYDLWFAQATTLDPTARYATASSMIAALAQALGVPLGWAPASPTPALVPSLPVAHGTPASAVSVPYASAPAPTPAHLSTARGVTAGDAATSPPVAQRGSTLPILVGVATLVLTSAGVGIFFVTRAPRDSASAAPRDSAEVEPARSPTATVTASVAASATAAAEVASAPTASTAASAAPAASTAVAAAAPAASVSSPRPFGASAPKSAAPAKASSTKPRYSQD
jgi:serine/threonine-protein kinase